MKQRFLLSYSSEQANHMLCSLDGLTVGVGLYTEVRMSPSFLNEYPPPASKPLCLALKESKEFNLKYWIISPRELDFVDKVESSILIAEKLLAQNIFIFLTKNHKLPDVFLGLGRSSFSNIVLCMESFAFYTEALKELRITRQTLIDEYDVEFPSFLTAV